MKRPQDIQRTAREIVLPDGRRVSTLYKDDFPGGEGPVLLTARSVWWGTRDMVFRADLATGKREVYLPWAGGKGIVQALEQTGDAVQVRTDSRAAKIRPESTTFDGYVRLRLGDDQLIPPPGVCQKLARTVEEWLGVPYLYGGDTKSGCDCSGFVGAMLRVAGKSVPRTSGAIAQAGKPVLGELRFGDVVCTPGHVALYLGSGWQAEAPQMGDVVKKTTIWHRASATARRFLGT
ncbi:C40 family peptidase [Armatimonas rosea]|uniref:Cell wall-associated NlpC family hydrolase n=1 Tax=Armatimonas rosea TaxID=685828 RepID=A0A7W9W471_ARMRO|nr:NlpC/P60 family protein [Armatimonas rosea]MBB6049129.1 cell wall-associated NlpC family hydrolase [Armatimonas rosea]